MAGGSWFGPAFAIVVEGRDGLRRLGIPKGGLLKNNYQHKFLLIIIAKKLTLSKV